MLKLIYELLVNPLGLPINPIWEYLIILVISEVAHEVAYSFSPGGRFGSIIYWISKLVTFVVMWAILYAIIEAILFISSNWIWFVIGVGVLVVIGIIILIVRYFKNRQKVQ